METIKGLIILLLVAVAVFTAVFIFNNQTEPGYEAAIEEGHDGQYRQTHETGHHW